MQESQNNQRQLADEIVDLVSRLWQRKMFIVKCCVAGALFGLMLGFSIPKIYKASVTFAPEVEQKMGSGVSSIASMMGINLNNSVDAISADMYPDVVHSTPFIFELLDLPVQFVRKDSTINTTLLDYMCEYQKAPWWSYVFNAPFKLMSWGKSLLTGAEEEEVEVADLNPLNLPKKERTVVKFFSESIEVFIDKKTSKVSMSIELQDREVAAAVMNAVVENLKEFMSDYRTSKARQDVANLSIICEQRKAEYLQAQKTYALFVDANQNVIRQSAKVESERLKQEMDLAYQVYSQVAAQLEAARIQEQQAKPVVVIIDPVTVPLRRSAPSKAKLLVLFTFLAGCCAAAWVLYCEEYFHYMKSRL